MADEALGSIEDDTRVLRTEEGDEYEYRVDADGSACLVRCNSKASELVVPDRLDGFPVAEFSTKAFYGAAKAKRIVCPPTLRRIAFHAFEGCRALKDVEFNEGLESLGEEIFTQCWMVKGFEVPSTVRRFGANPMGFGRERFNFGSTKVVVHPDNPFLFVDGEGAVYERAGDGLVLVDGSRFDGTDFTCDPRTVGIGRNAFAQRTNLERVVLPQGCLSIGDGAFRGCGNLSEIVFPETLERIGAGPFSNTALRSIYLPAGCTQLDPTALEIGPASGVAVQSDLEKVDVHPDNPVYCMVTGVLCRRIDDTSLEAVLAPRKVSDVHLSREVVSASKAVFSATAEMGTLHIHDAIAHEGEAGLVPHGMCKRLVVDLSDPVDGFDVVDLDMPSGSRCPAILETPLTNGVDVASLLRIYDEAVPEIDDVYELGRLVVARLARPVGLAEATRRLFLAIVEANFDGICIHFGARNYWAGFAQLVDAGLVDEQRVSDIIELLSSAGDATSVNYLLEFKQERFGKARWDFEL